MMPNWFRPKGGSFGTNLVATDVELGTGAITLGNTNTVSVLLPKPACTTCQLVSISFGVMVVAVSAGQTLTLQLFKRDNSGTPADRTLTATKSILSDVVTTVDQAYPIAITATSIQNLTFQKTDACRIDAVASGSVSTQPTMYVTATWAIIQP